MDLQMAFNIAVALIAFLGGWVMNNLRDSMNNLRDADAALTSKVQAIEVLVAGEYVKKDDMEKLIDAVFKKLDRIEDKIDQKADKHV